MITIVGLIVSLIGGSYMSILKIHVHVTLHLDHVVRIHMSSKHYGENCNMHSLDLLILSH